MHALANAIKVIGTFPREARERLLSHAGRQGYNPSLHDPNIWLSLVDEEKKAIAYNEEQLEEYFNFYKLLVDRKVIP